MTLSRPTVGLTLAAYGLLALASLVGAQPVSFDHLECYQIKDPLRRGQAIADLVPELPPFLAGLGCKIKLPAREYCTRSSKQNLQPPAVSSVTGEHAGDYFCYRVACPRDKDLHSTPVESEDQFGRRTSLVRRLHRLCVPAVRSTPTPIVPSPTPTHDPGCSFDGSECQGFCQTANRCLWDPNQQRCICPPVFDLDCDHAVVSCGGGLCYGPGQQCQPNPQSTAQPCACVTATATPTPRPCNNSLFPQCGDGDCGPFSACFNFGSFCGCEPPTPAPTPTP